MEEGIVVRVYGFVHQSYVLPTFLTPRIFALELIKKELIVENEHFINFRKSLEIKFPWVVGPFIIKSKVSLPIVESLLKEMDFKTTFVVNYDPLHVISIIRKVNTNNFFEHQEVEGLDKKEYWSYCLAPMENVEVPQENPLAVVEAT